MDEIKERGFIETETEIFSQTRCKSGVISDIIPPNEMPRDSEEGFADYMINNQPIPRSDVKPWNDERVMSEDPDKCSFFTSIIKKMLGVRKDFKKKEIEKNENGE